MSYWEISLLIVLTGEWLLELLVVTLDLGHAGTKPPPEFASLYDDERFAKAIGYQRINAITQLIQSSIVTGFVIIVVRMEWFDALNDLCAYVVDRPYMRSLPFFGIVSFATFMTELPFDIYKTFVIEERFGFNNTTWKTFLTDRIKGAVVIAVFGPGMILGTVWLFDRYRDSWILVWIFLTVVQLFVLFIMPSVIMPLFNKFTPLQDGELKDKLMAYAKRQNFALNGIFVMDGSKRSNKANAFFTGFGKLKRIVLFDTLIENHSNDQLLAILAHEMGHYKKRHLAITIVTGSIKMGIILWLVSKIIFIQNLYCAFGMKSGETPIYAGILFAIILFGPIDTLTSIVTNWMSRLFEKQADEHTVQTVRNGGELLIRALTKMTADTLTNLNPHPIKVFLEYSHPPTIERIRTIRKYENKSADNSHNNRQTTIR